MNQARKACGFCKAQPGLPYGKAKQLFPWRHCAIQPGSKRED